MENRASSDKIWHSSTTEGSRCWLIVTAPVQVEVQIGEKVTGQACRERWDGENVGGGVEWMDAGGRSEGDKDEDEDEDEDGELDAGPTEEERQILTMVAMSAVEVWERWVKIEHGWRHAQPSVRSRLIRVLSLGEMVWCLAVVLGLIGIHQETAVTIAGLFQEVLATSMLFLAL
ncbi:hypothetical protein CSOJ01_07450 [Colletotrichum sojae]|uniref:Uncharacterized protein n=1 Tax=Colletotrichum sojae TaxID=2175907 RepID=A0A8H6MUC8_9PEZI|nr:hypothetical protein CSOJ01_07450 [Colletotrichum sojae]